MAFTTVITHATGDVFPASDWNTYIRDNIAFLHGDSGAPVTFNNDLTLGSAVGQTSPTIGTNNSLFVDNAGAIYHGASGAGNFLLAGTVNGDVGDWRFSISAGGSLAWVPGSSARDTTLQRTAAGILGLGTSTQPGQLRTFQSSTTGLGYAMYVTTDANARYTVAGDGTIAWGPGTTGTDTSLNRASAGVLTANSKLAESYLSTSGGAATWTPSFANGLVQRYNMTGTGTLTIASPGTPPTNFSGFLVIIVHNAAGATVTLAWNAVYTGSVQTSLATVAPTLYATFVYNPGEAKWQQLTSVAN